MSKKVSKKQIRKGFKKYVVKEKKAPCSIQQLASYLSLEAAEIKPKYRTVQKVEFDIINRYFKDTIAALEQDDRFPGFSLQEKHLSFLFTLIEVASPDKTFLKRWFSLRKTPSHFIEGMKGFKKFQNSKLNWLGEELNFIKNVKGAVTIAYQKSLWNHAWAALKFWTKDTTEEHTETDAFIEKSTMTYFQFMNIGALESLFDLGKFMSKHIKVKSLFNVPS